MRRDRVKVIEKGKAMWFGPYSQAEARRWRREFRNFGVEAEVEWMR